jgi:hypothetical protein
MTTKTPVTVRPVPDAREVPAAMEALREGLHLAANELDCQQWDAAYHALQGNEAEPAAVAAFAPVVNAAVEEVLPEVAGLLTRALNRRLPWTWEPKR